MNRFSNVSPCRHGPAYNCIVYLHWRSRVPSMFNKDRSPEFGVWSLLAVEATLSWQTEYLKAQRKGKLIRKRLKTAGSLESNAKHGNDFSGVKLGFWYRKLAEGRESSVAFCGDVTSFGWCRRGGTFPWRSGWCEPCVRVKCGTHIYRVSLIHLSRRDWKTAWDAASTGFPRHQTEPTPAKSRRNWVQSQKTCISLW